MGSQEEKERKIRRIRNHIAKDLRREEYRLRVVTPKKGEYKRVKKVRLEPPEDDDLLDLDTLWAIYDKGKKQGHLRYIHLTTKQEKSKLK